MKEILTRAFINILSFISDNSNSDICSDCYIRYKRYGREHSHAGDCETFILLQDLYTSIIDVQKNYIMRIGLIAVISSEWEEMCACDHGLQ